MIERIPARAIIRVWERQGRMLVEDLTLQRPVPLDEADSILTFWQFIEAVRTGLAAPIPACVPPAGHLNFYRKTIDRLVEAQELPAHAKSEFESLFGAGCLRSPVEMVE